MPFPDQKKRIYNPDDESQFIDVPIIDRLNVQHGSGAKFQRRLNRYINTKENKTRGVKGKTITHKAVNEDGSPNPDDTDDPTQRVQVEVIDKFVTTHGRGKFFQRNIVQLEQDKKKSGRKVHRRRLFGKGANSTCYFDIERTDQLSVTHGRGKFFRREIFKLTWDDDAFDASAVPLWDKHPNDGFDPPWRLDPFQSIVNVHWDREHIALLITWGFTQSGLDLGSPSFCSPPNLSDAGLSPLFKATQCTTLFNVNLTIGNEAPDEDWTLVNPPSHPDDVTFDPWRAGNVNFGLPEPSGDGPQVVTGTTETSASFDLFGYTISGSERCGPLPKVATPPLDPPEYEDEFGFGRYYRSSDQSQIVPLDRSVHIAWDGVQLISPTDEVWVVDNFDATAMGESISLALRFRREV